MVWEIPETFLQTKNERNHIWSFHQTFGKTIRIWHAIGKETSKQLRRHGHPKSIKNLHFGHDTIKISRIPDKQLHPWRDFKSQMSYGKDTMENTSKNNATNWKNDTFLLQTWRWLWSQKMVQLGGTLQTTHSRRLLPTRKTIWIICGHPRTNSKKHLEEVLPRTTIWNRWSQSQMWDGSSKSRMDKTNSQSDHCSKWSSTRRAKSATIFATVGILFPWKTKTTIGDHSTKKGNFSTRKNRKWRTNGYQYHTIPIRTHKRRKS